MRSSRAAARPMRAVQEFSQGHARIELIFWTYPGQPGHQRARRSTLHEVAQDVGVQQIHQASKSTGRPVSRSRAA
jgi:hypothetical protein